MSVRYQAAEERERPDRRAGRVTASACTTSAMYRSITERGIRPRSATWIPCSCAQRRTVAGVTGAVAARRVRTAWWRGGFVVAGASPAGAVLSSGVGAVGSDVSARGGGPACVPIGGSTVLLGGALPAAGTNGKVCHQMGALVRGGRQHPVTKVNTEETTCIVTPSLRLLKCKRLQARMLPVALLPTTTTAAAGHPGRTQGVWMPPGDGG